MSTGQTITLGERLKQARKDKKWSRDELAFRSRVSPRQIARWEADLHSPRLDGLTRIAAALEIDVAALLGEDAA